MKNNFSFIDAKPYLIFEDSTVFNIRSNEGLRVEINIE